METFLVRSMVRKDPIRALDAGRARPYAPLVPIGGDR